MMALSRSRDFPLHTQLRIWLIEQLQLGRYAPGDLLPSEKDLEEMHGVSRMTVRRALGDLATAGYIVRQAGRGSIVVQRKLVHSEAGLGGLTEELRAQGMKVSSKFIEFGKKVPPEHIARLLGVGPGVRLLHHYRLILVNDIPFSLGSGYHNLGIEVDISPEELEGDTMANILSKRSGIQLRRIERSIEAAAADEQEAELLQINVGAPVLVAQLRIFADYDEAVAYRRAIYRGDSYRYVHTLTI